LVFCFLTVYRAEYSRKPPGCKTFVPAPGRPTKNPPSGGKSGTPNKKRTHPSQDESSI
jgi:hypothetical protein